MSVNVFTAGFNINFALDLGGNVWRIDGDIIDFSNSGFSASDALVGDIIFDESPWFGTINRWKISSIVSTTVFNLVCDVIWDDEGVSDLNGPQPSVGAICRPTPNKKLSETPSQIFTTISEPLQNRIRNIDNRYILDNASSISGYSGLSGYSGIDGATFSSGYSGISGYSGVDGATASSGYSGISGISGYSGIWGSSGYSGLIGYSGISGISGYSGVDGATASSGYSGLSGYSGVTSPQYIHHQISPSSAWPVNHNLNQKFLNVEIIDTLDKVIRPDEIIYLDENNLEVLFPDIIAGKASIIGGSSGVFGQSELRDISDGTILTPGDFTRVIISDSTSIETIYLPAVTSAHIGKWIKILKLGSQLNIYPVGSTYIDSYNVGDGIYSNDINVSVITLQLIRLNRWIVVNKIGTWSLIV